MLTYTANNKTSTTHALPDKQAFTINIVVRTIIYDPININRSYRLVLFVLLYRYLAYKISVDIFLLFVGTL